jgi:hypothetical protein
MNVMLASETPQGVDKTKRYGWVTKDIPGELTILHKDKLQVHPAYQRDVIPNKVKEITANWSWVAAGAIVVGERGGEFWIIDGQHRVLAAKRRSDIDCLPCLVFQTESVKQEAIAFLDLNAGRKPVSSIAKFKAMTAADDQVACAVNDVLSSLGVSVASHAKKAREMNGVAWCIKKAKENVEKFEIVMRVAVDISGDTPIKERLLDGLWYINEKLPGGITEKRFYDRLHSVGAKRLIEAANRSAAYFVAGGAKVWATGMMDEINKGLHRKFSLTDSDIA